jgi:hypothetical protein
MAACCNKPCVLYRLLLGASCLTAAGGMVIQSAICLPGLEALLSASLCCSDIGLPHIQC